MADLLTGGSRLSDHPAPYDATSTGPSGIQAADRGSRLERQCALREHERTCQTTNITTGASPTVRRTRATTHQIAGLGLAAVTAAALDVDAAGAASLLAGAWAGSLLPDADRAGSRVYRPTRLERRLWPLRAAGWIARVPLRALALLGHRGITHSFAACAAAAALAWLLASLIAPAAAATIGAGVAIGYLAHIAADACTPSGVPLLAPASARRRWLLPAPARVPTGSLRELLVAILLTTASATATVLLVG